MKKRVLEDVTIECEVPSHFRWHGDMERRAQEIQRWAKDFEEFIRDHRSQDPVSLTVHRKYVEVCSHCNRDWEEDGDGPVCCAAAQAEHAAQEPVNA